MTTTSSRLLAALVSVGVIVAACGGSDDAESTDTAPAATEALDTDPVDTGPVETDPVDTGPVDTDPVDTAPTEESTTTVEEPPPTAEPVTRLDDEVVVALGANVWPIVGDLLALGIEPDAIVRNETSQGRPDYLDDPFGDVIDQATDIPVVLTALNAEELAAVGGTVLAAPSAFEPVIPPELLDLYETVIFTDLFDWRTSLEAIVDGIGEDQAVLDEFDALYADRLADVAAAIGPDVAELTFSFWSAGADGTATVFPTTGPGAKVLLDLGLTPIPLMPTEPGNAILSLEEVDQLDADVVFFSDRSSTPVEDLGSLPIWATTGAQQDGRVFEVSNAWNQGGWFDTLSVFDDLEAIFADFEPPAG
ncbi:MAG: ABC transporter substrate-binding protein [Actinomycetota bacterium]